MVNLAKTKFGFKIFTNLYREKKEDSSSRQGYKFGIGNQSQKSDLVKLENAAL